jgi:hypothetical protein
MLTYFALLRGRVVDDTLIQSARKLSHSRLTQLLTDIEAAGEVNQIEFSI